MKTTKTISITAQEILEHYVMLTEGCTQKSAQEILKTAEIYYDIKETGDVDRGNYERILKEIEISYEN